MHCLQFLAVLLSFPALAGTLVTEATPEETRRAVAEMEVVNRLREVNIHPELLQLPAELRAKLTAAEARARAAPPAR